MLVVNRFRVPEPDGETFRVDLEAARDALAARPGFVSATVGRNVDDPELWVLTTTWDNVGAYRRALGSLEVKMTANALLSLARDLPTAFEPLLSIDPLRGRITSRSDRRVDDSGSRSTAPADAEP